MRFAILLLVPAFSSLVVSAAGIPSRREAPQPVPTALPQTVPLTPPKAPTSLSLNNAPERRQFHNADFGTSGSPPASNIESAASAASVAPTTTATTASKEASKQTQQPQPAAAVVPRAF